MRLVLSFWVAAILLGALPRISLAQTSTPQAALSCSGLNLNGIVSMTVSYLGDDNVFHDLPFTAIGGILNRAECMCDPTDLFVEITLTANVSTDATDLQIWVGRDCANPTNRNSTSTQCVQITSPDVSLSQFLPGGGTSAPLYQRIPVRALMLTGGTSSCDSGTVTSNSIWFIFRTSSSTSGSDPACSLQLPGRLTQPIVPDTVRATGGEKALNVAWETETQSDTGRQVQRYQVLCARASNGQPVRTEPPRSYYTTCTPGGLRRQYITEAGTHPAGGVTGGGGGYDGGVGPDGGTPDGGTTDGGTTNTDGGTADGGDGGVNPCANAVIPQGFIDLDPTYACSDSITGTSGNARIEGLENGVGYQVLLVGIDAYGNASPASPIVCAAPGAVDNVYVRYLAEGGQKQGCFIATAAHGSYESPYVQVLRRFRDEVLLTSERGRGFVDWYYRNSPSAADYIASPEHGAVRWTVRLLLWPVIAMAWLWLELGPMCLVLLAVACAAVAMRRQLAQALALGSEGSVP